MGLLLLIFLVLIVFGVYGYGGYAGRWRYSDPGGWIGLIVALIVLWVIFHYLFGVL